MGGDNAPDANIQGAINVINKIKSEIVLIGKENIIKEKIKEFTGKDIKEVSDRLSIKNATETIEMIDFAYSIYEQWLEDAMLRGAVHPVASIFLLKCNSGYQEEQKVIIQNDNVLGELEDASKIAERYQNIVE